MAAGTNSGNDRLISHLPLRVFVKLISGPRSTVSPIDPASLRDRILSKLSSEAAAAADGGGGISTIRDILNIPPTALPRILDPCLTYAECNRLLSRIHRECAAEPLSASEVARRARSSSTGGVGKVPTGLPTLDACLRGGIPVGSVAELVGRAGVGKTHLAQQLVVSAATAGGGAIYVDAERRLSLPRLREIALERTRASGPDPSRAGDSAQRVLENVTIHRPLATSELLDVLDRLGEEIILRNSEARKEAETDDRDPARRLPVRLVVIDSIAAPVRRDFEIGSSSYAAAHRASAIFQIARRLKRLAHDHRLAVVVVNQVGSGHDSSRRDYQRNRTLDIDDDGEFTASLGTAWQYCATTRVVLEHEDDPHRLQGGPRGDGGSIRVATLTKSLVSKRTRLTFELTQQGLREVSPARDCPDP